MTSSKSHVTQHTFYSLMLSNGADIVDRETGEKVIFDSPETAETLKFYKELAGPRLRAPAVMIARKRKRQ